MALKLEGISVVIPLSEVYKVYEGGEEAFWRDNQPTAEECDGEIICMSFSNAIDAECMIQDWKRRGLKSTRKKQGMTYWHDLCVVDFFTGPTLPCDWLVYDPVESLVSLKVMQKAELPCRETIIFLHGKESTPATSSSAKDVKEFFTDYDVLVPDYRPLERNHEEIEAFLTEFIEDAMKNDHMVHLVGISLGGYWAYTMGCKIPGISHCILLNPSFRCYPEIPVVPPKPGLPISLIVNLDDDVVNPHDVIERFTRRAYIKAFYAGGHRFSNRDEMIEEIEKSLNSIVGCYL